MKIISTLFLFAFLVLACGSQQAVISSEEDLSQSAENIKKYPKNIILLIGDGMGLSEISAGLYYNDAPSNFERFQTIGLIKTSSSSDLITDSAAGATAFSAGIKTYNGAIGVDKDQNPAETIVEIVSKKGLATGLVATSSVVHATPGSFYAHQKKRKFYENIAYDLVLSDIDFFAGGGLKFFNQRSDGRDLLVALERKDFEVHTSQLPTAMTTKKQAILLAEDGMPKMIENRGSFLQDATTLAIQKMLENEEGFFLMIEGSQIDWGGHNNEADYLIGEQIDFDKTIGTVLDFAEKNGETLVIVTADHETGGFTLATKNGDYNQIEPVFSTGGHSATMVPVFAKGPMESDFAGIYENTAIFHKMVALFNQKRKQ